MKFTTSTQPFSSLSCDTIVLPISKKLDPTTYTNGAIAALGKPFETWLESCAESTEACSIAVLPIIERSNTPKNLKHIILLGLGSDESMSPRTFKKCITALVSSLRQIKALKVGLDLACISVNDNDSDWTTRFAVERIEHLAYQFNEYKSKKAPKPLLKEIAFLCEKTGQRKHSAAIKRALAISEGSSIARDLGNQPGNVCTPKYLAEQALELGKQHESIEVKVLEEKDMKKLKMGAFLSVSKGSVEPGKLVLIEYRGAAKSQKPHIIVGKGITFDTGGISLKPGAQMDEMKYDMCGAASVMGTMTAIANIKPKMNIIGVMACAENMPAGNASKPGDIVTTSSGKTVEILNTDAEGRLVLCDTLTYVERYKPASVVDIATLTGACIVALGHHISAVMTNHQELAVELVNAGHQADDKVWQLPLGEEYQAQIDSPFADMQNIGGRGAGTITAGCFLARFAESYHWAHLDIAGTAWTSGGKDKGATGRPVPLLVQYLMNKIES